MSWFKNLVAAVVNWAVSKPVAYVAEHVEGTEAGQATAAAVTSIATSAANAAIDALVARYKPAAIAAVQAQVTKLETGISATSPATIVQLEDQLHSAVGGNGWAVGVVSALQAATTVAIATGAAQAGIAAGDDLSKAQLDKLQAAVVAAINAA